MPDKDGRLVPSSGDRFLQGYPRQRGIGFVKVNCADGIGTAGCKFQFDMIFDTGAGFLFVKIFIDADEQLGALQHGAFAKACKQHPARYLFFFGYFQVERRPHSRFGRRYVGVVILNVFNLAFGSAGIECKLIADGNAFTAERTGYRDADSFQRKGAVDIQERLI